MQSDPFFPLSLYDAFTQDLWASPDADPLREPVYHRMCNLLEKILPNLIKMGWDIHPHWVPAYRVSHFHVSNIVPMISSMQIRLSKNRESIQWMEDNLLRDFGRQANHIRLECRISEHGFAVQLFLDQVAWIDGRNLVGKLLRSPDAVGYREVLAQHFVKISPDSHLRIYRPYKGSDHWWHSYAIVNEDARSLNDVDEIEWQLSKYKPGEYHLSIGTLYKPNDIRISETLIVQEIMNRFEELYPIYELIAWTSDNDFRNC